LLLLLIFIVAAVGRRWENIKDEQTPIGFPLKPARKLRFGRFAFVSQRVSCIFRGLYHSNNGSVWSGPSRQRIHGLVHNIMDVYQGIIHAKGPSQNNTFKHANEHMIQKLKILLTKP
jgi:hypothetical protein